MQEANEGPEVKELCPPHAWKGPKAICEHCGATKGSCAEPREWNKRWLATAYQCDTKGCRATYSAMQYMYQWGRAFLCEDCHKDRLAAKAAQAADADAEQLMCVICGEQPASDGKQTCGNAAGKCAKMLKRRSDKQAEKDG